MQIVAAILVLAMTATTFLTQRQLMAKNMPATRCGPYAQQQKMLLYVLPVVFAVGGIAFPIGVLLYWTTSNLWTMGQQFYVIRNNPAPGTEAAKARRSATARRPRPRASPWSAPDGQHGGGDRGRGGRSSGRPAPAAEAPSKASARRAASPRSPGATAESQNESRDGKSEWSKTATRRIELDERIEPGPRPGVRRPRGGVDDRRDRRRVDERGQRGRGGRVGSRLDQLETEGEIAADYLEELLDIADLDGDLDMDVEGDRAAVSIVGADLSQLVGRDGEVLEALQELTRLAVYRETGERSRLMLDISGYRADKRDAAREAGRGDRRPGEGERRARLARPDDAVRAQGRPRRGGRRRADLGVRGRRAASVRGGASSREAR